MTKQEIEQAAKATYKRDDTLAGLMREAFKKGAEMVNQKQPYSAEDMESLSEWMSLKGWLHSPFKKVWYNRFNENVLTFSQLIKLWEEQ